uniref:Uncharacterized protein n=1 Tax=Rhizophora mucronata TaxID=61149 RepID=A0A2P2PAZ3_RHIMU
MIWTLRMELSQNHGWGLFSLAFISWNLSLSWIQLPY